MTRTRLLLAPLMALALSTPLGSAPQARYDYYLTGSPANIVANTTFGLGLMGGGTDVDALFTWMSDRAGGGDFVVIRASGADGYNQYVFDLGDFDSVETLVLSNRAASADSFVLEKIRNAETRFSSPAAINPTMSITGKTHRSKRPSTSLRPKVCRLWHHAARPFSANSCTRHSGSRRPRPTRLPIRSIRTSRSTKISSACHTCPA